MSAKGLKVVVSLSKASRISWRKFWLEGKGIVEEEYWNSEESGIRRSIALAPRCCVVEGGKNFLYFSQVQGGSCVGDQVEE